MIIARGLAAGAVISGLAIGVAGPVSAEPLSGSYTGTITAVNPAGQGANVGQTTTFTLTPCGPDCTTMAALNVNVPWATDLHLQGSTWTGHANQAGDCALTLDNNSLAFTTVCPSVTIHQALTRNA